MPVFPKLCAVAPWGHQKAHPSPLPSPLPIQSILFAGPVHGEERKPWHSTEFPTLMFAREPSLSVHRPTKKTVSPFFWKLLS